MQKKIVLRIFLAAEILVFGWLYYHGARGVQAVHLLQKENDEIASKTAYLQEEIHDIDSQIIAWKTDPFFKEKIAREQLHMAQAADEIYFFE